MRLLHGQAICSANLVLLLVLLAGCDQANLMREMTAPEDESAAINYVDLLRQNKVDQIEKDLDHSLEDAGTQSMLASMAGLFPNQQPVSVKVVGMQGFRDGAFSSVNITLEYEFPEKWLLANVVTKRGSGSVTITGFHVYEISDSLEHRNRFTLADMSVGKFTTLLFAVVAVVLSLYAFVVCIRTNLKRKWLWSIVSLLGVGQLSINWITGEARINALAFHLPPGGATATPYGPWVVYVSLPVGAILFLLLRDAQRLPVKQV